MMEKYWFVLYPNTFLWVKDDKGLIYNTDNNVKIDFVYQGELVQIAKELLDIDNLYRVLLTEETLMDENVNAWIRKIVDTGCGNLVPDDGIAKKPVSLKPVLKIQDGVDYYKWEHRQGIDGDLIHNLHHLFFYVNGSAYGNELYSRQTIYPVTSQLTLDLDKIRWFAMNARNSNFLSEISLVGNPQKITKLHDTIIELKNICPVSIYITIQDFVNDLSLIKELSSLVVFNVLITDYELLDQLSDIQSWINDISYTFLVASEEDYEAAFKYIDEHSLENMNVIPLYNSNNLSFFENYLFLDQEELQNVTLSKKDIFVRQALNIFNFGRLFVMPDGNVYSNVNDVSIGTINESPHSIVYREITEGNSWFRIRNEKPCCDCIYQWLCPSPSDYEAVIGKSNLCHIN